MSPTHSPIMQPTSELDVAAGDDGGNIDDKTHIGAVVGAVVLLLCVLIALGTVVVTRQRRKRKQGQRQSNTMELQGGWAGESTTDGPESPSPPYLDVSPDDLNYYARVSLFELTETNIDCALGFLTELKDGEVSVDKSSAARDSRTAARGKRRSRNGSDSQPNPTYTSRHGALATVNAAMDKDLLSFSDAMASVTPAYMEVMPDAAPGALETYGGLIGAVSDPLDYTPVRSKVASSTAGVTPRRLDEMPDRQRSMANARLSRSHLSMSATYEERKPRLTTNAWGHVEQGF